MKDFHVGFKLKRDGKETNHILRFREISVDKSLEILSPKFDIFNEGMEAKDYLKMVKYATQGESRFVFSDDDGGNPQPLDYQKIFGKDKIILFVSVLTGYLISGDIKEADDGIEKIVKGDYESVKQGLSIANS